MVPNKSLDDSITIIATLLCDVQTLHGSVFNTKALRLTSMKLRKRVYAEGMGFLTKTLPRLGKAFDKAISGQHSLNATELGFESQPGSKLPRFLGEFFSRVLQPDGALLEQPCTACVGVIRDVLYLFYKYELPYTDEQEHQVVERFKQTEVDLATTDKRLHFLEDSIQLRSGSRVRDLIQDPRLTNVTRRAKLLLWEVFRSFNPKDIHPRHGPGAVATKQKHSGKYLWTNVSAKITDVYPFDAYFCASLGHVCDRYQSFSTIGDKDLPARVVLVPKDSRGPRLISCEPVDKQWVQQGLGRAIVDLVESHPLTRDNVRFTDQTPNRFAALYGSESKRYATLDLNEASDRVSSVLVRLLFPSHVYTCLEACRSSSTLLPNGQDFPLSKFAPMGSALCFPIMALVVWAILTAATDDTDTRESIYVYGDDVIVPTAYAANAIERLESYGLRVNKDKSCTGGSFRESCGMDAFQGVNVTPVRLRTVWSYSPRPESYSSWIAYANSFYDKKYNRVYDLIHSRLFHLYGPIPSEDMFLTCPSLRYVPEDQRPKTRRFNKSLQKLQWKVWDLKSPAHTEVVDGWSMLLRYFAEATSDIPFPTAERHQKQEHLIKDAPAFSVSRYTSRRASMLVRRWR